MNLVYSFENLARITQSQHWTMDQIGLLSVTLDKNNFHIPVAYVLCIYSSWEKSYRHIVKKSFSHLILGLKIKIGLTNDCSIKLG